MAGLSVLMALNRVPWVTVPLPSSPQNHSHPELERDLNTPA